ncbi:polyphosphate--glucose phosphotransferase [Prescottella agglutinans]|uniref:polyphosphate--glucose phosphotransferase n=1 Tax=Prescottella agglutinans TaxID=1644129 RepID=UPI003D9560A8
MVGAHGFGVDVGGSGIKGAIVDLTTGELVADRIKIETPRPATPEAVAVTVAEIVARAGWEGPVGITLPSVVTSGIARTAANIDKSWIGTDAQAVFSRALGGRDVSVLNDADAAGLAEDRYGAGKDVDGVVVLLTFGTGIGSAIIHNGVLLPNTEFGHMEVDGQEAEHRAASSVKETKGLSYKEWAAEVTRVLCRFEDLLWPDLFIVGGGISRKHEKWIPRLENRTPVVPAALLNTAGIVGAALCAANRQETGIAP